ncbi:MAG: Putative diheme cytochrome c-553, partial [uncultured Gemmatimonadaceae bacterium]
CSSDLGGPGAGVGRPGAGGAVERPPRPGAPGARAHHHPRLRGVSRRRRRPDVGALPRRGAGPRGRLPDRAVRDDARGQAVLPDARAQPHARQRDGARPVQRAADLQRAPLRAAPRRDAGRGDHLDDAGAGQLPGEPEVPRAADAVARVAAHERPGAARHRRVPEARREAGAQPGGRQRGPARLLGERVHGGEGRGLPAPPVPDGEGAGAPL